MGEETAVETEVPSSAPAEMTTQPAAPAQPETNDQPWYSAVEDADLRGFVEKKGYKTLQDALTGHRNAEKLIGAPADQILRLPDDMTAEGALDPVWDRLGRPETADKYTAVLPAEHQDDGYKKLAEVAHRVGVTDAGWQELQKTVAEVAEGATTARQDAYDAEFDNFKGARPQDLQNVQRMLGAVGATEEQVTEAMQGNAAVFYDILSKVAARSSEQPAVDPGNTGGSFAMSPEAAQIEVNNLYSDKTFMDQYYSDNPQVRKGAVARMERLQKIASGGK